MEMIIWESIESNNYYSMVRSKIPGGWLVRFETHYVQSGAGGLTFVPDPNHQWDGSSLK